MITTARC